MFEEETAAAVFVGLLHLINIDQDIKEIIMILSDKVINKNQAPLPIALKINHSPSVQVKCLHLKETIHSNLNTANRFCHCINMLAQPGYNE